MELKYFVQATPNPNAKKFIFNKDVKDKGKITYNSAEECENNPMGASLFDIEGVSQVHFYENVITVTQDGSHVWDTLEDAVIALVQDGIKDHDPAFVIELSIEERRKDLPEELRQIEEILDKTIRPGLQGDGGDIVVVEYNADHKMLSVKYEGACVTCPSSSMGTLFAIKGVLNDEFDPELDVVILD